MSYKVFPAPAGINRRNGTRNRQEARVPRASGDKPTDITELARAMKCSPHSRG